MEGALVRGFTIGIGTKDNSKLSPGSSPSRVNFETLPSQLSVDAQSPKPETLDFELSPQVG